MAEQMQTPMAAKPAMPAAPAQPMAAGAQPMAEKKKSSWLTWALIIVAILVVGAGFWYWLQL